MKLELHNDGIPLDFEWIMTTRVNKSAVERRAASIPARRGVKKAWQVAWLLAGATFVDLTTLQGDDTEGNVRRLCQKAILPIRDDIIKTLGVEPIHVAAVCVYPKLVGVAAKTLAGSGIPVASVATGFPAGQTSLELKIGEINQALDDGAGEIDIVISRALVLTGKWKELYDEVRACKDVCEGRAHLKVILATGELATLENVYKASLVAMMAGADFIKTSTGKEPVNATLPVGLVMMRAIREYYQRTGNVVGFKAAGGIRVAKQCLAWMALVLEELGEEWLTPSLFRFGASGLLGDIERQLFHSATGRYAALHQMGMG